MVASISGNVMTASSETVKAFVTALEAGNVEGAIEWLDPDLILHENTRLPYGGTYRGHEGFKTLLGGIMQFWETIATGETRFVDDGEVVIVLGSMGGKVRRTGATISVPVIERYLVRDGRIKEIWPFYVDTDVSSADLGID